MPGKECHFAPINRKANVDQGFAAFIVTLADLSEFNHFVARKGSYLNAITI
jgi:hypothetical protein